MSKKTLNEIFKEQYDNTIQEMSVSPRDYPRLRSSVYKDQLVMSLKDKYTQEQILDAFYDLLDKHIYTDITEKMIEKQIKIKESDLYKTLIGDKDV